MPGQVSRLRHVAQRWASRPGAGMPATHVAAGHPAPHLAGGPPRPLVAAGLLFVVAVVGACGMSTVPPNDGTPGVTHPTAIPSAVSSARPPSATAPSAPAVGATITVYFTDRHRYEAAVEPYEVPVTRVGAGGAGPRDVLDAFFAGPTEAERAAGLMAVTSGFTGVRSLVVENGVAHVGLEGSCASGGATYTIAGAIRANLLPFAEIAWVKIYDESGTTERPTGQTDSIPLCLEP